MVYNRPHSTESLENIPLDSTPVQKGDTQKSSSKKITGHVFSKLINNATEFKIGTPSLPKMNLSSATFSAAKKDFSKILNRFKGGLSFCYNGIRGKINPNWRQEKLDHAIKSSKTAVNKLQNLAQVQSSDPEKAATKGFEKKFEKTVKLTEKKLEKLNAATSKLKNKPSEEVKVMKHGVEVVKQEIQNNKINSLEDRYNSAIFDCESALSSLRAENNQSTSRPQELVSSFSNAQAALRNHKAINHEVQNLLKKYQDSPSPSTENLNIAINEWDQRTIDDLEEQINIAKKKILENPEAETLLIRSNLDQTT